MEDPKLFAILLAVLLVLAVVVTIRAILKINACSRPARGN